ncbi:SIR2 family protein [Microvirga sp. G4-2]|uniref:SIR2 family protein n=1 Tax=Microvirga sp. G4-2 TaxID=3434467 RepID=UPI00404443A0
MPSPELKAFDALALSLHHSPGVYALLVGSGLSRSAGIATGWEITVDLIRRLAALDGVLEHPDWAAWYHDKYRKEPSYSEILDALASSPSERRSILHGYIDPAAESDARRPTEAHRAIAAMVAQGTIRVIITTNFDRLLENALRDVGVEPTVVASEDAIAGATPLVHSRCTVIKVHGDYLDTRIKNTEAELADYASGMNTLLDEVFDRFGLLVVGWSGEWDLALRAAILRTPSRRYPLYWAARGRTASMAQDLIDHRDGRVIPVTDADSFFKRLFHTLDALRLASRPHPASVSMALALVRKYCRDDAYAMEWSDFLAEESAKVRDFVTGSEYPTASPDSAAMNALVTKMVALTEVLRKAALICGRWGTANANKAVIRTIRSLVLSAKSPGGFEYWSALRDTGASLCFYWALAGMLDRGDHSLLKSMLDAPMPTRVGEEPSAVEVLPFASYSRYSGMEWKFLAGLENKKAPQSLWLASLLGAELGLINISQEEGRELADQLEFLIALEFGYRRLLRVKETGIHFYIPPGHYFWRDFGDYLNQRLDTYANLPADDPAFRAGLFGGTPASVAETAKEIRRLRGEIAG